VITALAQPTRFNSSGLIRPSLLFALALSVHMLSMDASSESYTRVAVMLMS